MNPSRPRPPRGTLDWAEARRRIEVAGRALAGERIISPEEGSRVLEARARALARPAAGPARDTLEVVTFALANEVYAVESRHLMGVGRLTDLSPLPGATSPVIGVTVWQGELLVILDLRAALGRSVTALNDLGWLLVLGEDRPAFGILADVVEEFGTLRTSEVRALPDGIGADRGFLRGVTTDAVLLLDGERLLQLLRQDRRAEGSQA